jgi:polyisoprenoid-binding protein YceI
MSTALSTVPSEAQLAPGRWVVDPHHSAVTFSIRHLGLARVRGRFDRFEATLDMGPTIAETRIAATVDLASVSTGQPDRDVHLRSTDFFSVERHPEMRFVSTGIAGGGEEWELSGNLTLNGVTRPITLEVEFNGVQPHPRDQKLRAGFTATGTLRRSAFGIEFGLLPLGGDKLALGDEVKIEIDVQLVEPGVAEA